MLQTLRLALCAITIAAGCGGGGDGDGNGPPPDGNDKMRCGDGTCTVGRESFSSCPQDCPPVVNCGDGTCTGDESCTLCAQDCGACPETCGNGVCGGTETCASCEGDCGCGKDQVCRENACAPISTNPLIESMPGTWIRVEPDDGEIMTVTVDPSQPDCGNQEWAPGDACVIGFSPSGSLILDDTRLHRVVIGDSWDGQVLDDGRLVEMTQTFEGGSLRYAYEKQD